MEKGNLLKRDKFEAIDFPIGSTNTELAKQLQEAVDRLNCGAEGHPGQRHLSAFRRDESPDRQGQCRQADAR